MLDDQHHACVEVLLRLLDCRQPSTFRCDHILDGDLSPVGLEDWVATGIVADGHEIPKDKEVGDFRGRD